MRDRRRSMAFSRRVKSDELCDARFATTTIGRTAWQLGYRFPKVPVKAIMGTHSAQSLFPRLVSHNLSVYYPISMMRSHSLTDLF